MFIFINLNQVSYFEGSKLQMNLYTTLNANFTDSHIRFLCTLCRFLPKELFNCITSAESPKPEN